MPALVDNSQLLDLCSRASNLANNISVHIVEYLDILKSSGYGLRNLAVNFFELCQTLWPIQSGCMEVLNTSSHFPEDVLRELEIKVKQTINDLTSVDLLITKLLTYERKKGLTKFVKGLGLGSVDGEIAHLGKALAQDRDALRMGSLAFRLVLGDDQTPTSVSMGSAYSTLAKVLKIPEPEIKKSSNNHTQAPLSKSLPPTTTQDDDARSISLSPRQAQTASLAASPSFRTLAPLPHPVSGLSANRTQRTLQIDSIPDYIGQSPVLSSPGSIKRSPTNNHTSPTTLSAHSSHQNMASDASSRTSINSIAYLEEMLQNVPVNGTTQGSFRPKRAPAPDRFRSINAGLATEKAALVSAVLQGNHKLLEELLQTGTHPSDISDVNLLSQAVLNEDIASIRLLMLFNADVNRTDQSDISALLAATQVGSVELAELLLKSKADPNLGSGRNGDTPLSLATRTGQREMIELYLKHKGDCNMILQNGDTPFIMGIGKDADAEVIEIMLSAGADPDGKTKEGKSPLFEAISVRRVDIMTLLLKFGANPNLAGPKHLLWPSTYFPPALELLISHGAKPKMTSGVMELAVSINSIESVKILLQAGVSPNLKKDGVYTPLCTAIRDDRADIVTLLLSHQADPNLPASEYPAFKCITHHRLQYLPALVAAGANLHEPSGILETAVAQHDMEAIMYLVSNKVDINARSAEGHTPLTTAIRQENVRFVDYLLKHGADPGIRGENWPLSMAVKSPSILKRLLQDIRSPGDVTKGIMELAVQADQLESVKLLFKAGVDVEDKTGGVFSPLTTAIRENKLDIVRYLIDEAGADINAPGEHLPLVKAIRRNVDPQDTQVIDMLLERGADINLVYRGWNAVMQAIEKGDSNILRSLIDKGNGVDLQIIDPESGKAVIDLVKGRGWQEGISMLMEYQQQTRMITSVAW